MDPNPLRACLKIQRGPVLKEMIRWRGARREHPPCGAVTDEQRSQWMISFKTLRAAVLLAATFVEPRLPARSGDASRVSPRQTPKSLAAGPLSIFRQTLTSEERKGGSWMIPCPGVMAEFGNRPPEYFRMPFDFCIGATEDFPTVCAEDLIIS